MRLFLLMALVLMLASCRSAATPTPPAPPATPVAQATVSLQPITPLPADPTPTTVTLRVWVPAAFAPDTPLGATLAEQVAQFEAATPDAQVLVEPKAISEVATLTSYLRAANAVAPAVLPDLLIFPSSAWDGVAHSDLLSPLDEMVGDEIRADLYPFATRDLSDGDRWLAVPLLVEVTHGAMRRADRSEAPATLDDLAAPAALRWRFSALPIGDGEVSDPLLLQMLALNGIMPQPGQVPPRDQLVALFAALMRAEQAGVISRQMFQLGDGDSDLLADLKSDAADLVQVRSAAYRTTQAESDLAAVPLPTLTGQPVAVVDGYLIAVASSEPRHHAAAGDLLRRILSLDALASWGDTEWLPARRSALASVESDAAYRALLDSTLSHAWFRPQGSTWRDFAREVQTQYRAVITGQSTPENAADALIQKYGD